MHLEKMTRKEAAEHLGVSVQTLANWACTGKVKSLFISWGAKCCICALISMLILHPLAERRRCKGGVMAHKTKATAKGSPVGTRENKSITNNATFAAGGQCDQCAGLLVSCQPLGSMPSLRSLSRQAFFTHELKLPGPATSLICCNNVSSKRMFFFVLPERSNFGFTFSSCIGTYHRYKLKSMVRTTLKIRNH